MKNDYHLRFLSLFRVLNILIRILTKYVFYINNIY